MQVIIRREGGGSWLFGGLGSSDRFGVGSVCGFFVGDLIAEGEDRLDLCLFLTILHDFLLGSFGGFLFNLYLILGCFERSGIGKIKL